MSDPTLAEKDPAVILAEALATYKGETGVSLAPPDPRRLHLQALLLLVSQLRALIDYSGKQSLLRFVGDEFIDELAALWGEERLEALASETTERFNFASSGPHTVPAGIQVTDGTNVWQVVEDTSETGIKVDAVVRCIVAGGGTNGVAIGQIDQLVNPDDIPGGGVVSVSNLTATSKGRELEGLEAFRERLRKVPESRSTCGPRNAYQAAALEADSAVADAVALGPDDAGDVASYAHGDGEVFVLILEGERDDDGVLTSVIPAPTAGLLTTVDTALDAEDVRPLTDHVTTMAPLFVEFDAIYTYYIARSRSKSAAAIQAAVDEAFNAYLLWQQSKIGRDINPSEGITRLVNAGAKRVVTAGSTAFTALLRDQSARCSYAALVYGGVEDD
jgi:phage-related baseplate assembly protein